MKKIIILFITICIFPTFTFAQQTIKLVDGSVVDSLLETIPQRDIQVSGDSIRVTYYFNNVCSQTDPLYPTAKILRIDGFGNNSKIYEPSYLFREDTFTIPDSTSYHIEIVDSDYIEIPMVLSPSRPILAENTYDTYTTENVPPINAFPGYFPSSLIIGTEIDKYRDTPLLMVRLCPVQYNHYQNKVRIYRRISYVISNTGNRSNAKINDSRSFGNYYDTFLGNTTLNYQLNTPQLHSASGTTILLPTEDYLIISVPHYSEAINKLAEWKRNLGYNVHTILNSNWTTECAKNVIDSIYHTSNNLRYLLIIGDQNDVIAPLDSIKYNENNSIVTDYFTTDFYYSCIGNTNTLIPDICWGRLPVSSLQEAIEVINKIIKYEKQPINNINFYNTGMHCSYFQDEPKGDVPRDGYADRRFAQTSEEIRDYVMEQGKNINRIYYAKPEVNPQHWNNGSYSFGEEIPHELKKPFFQWDGNVNNIIQNTNTGVFYIYYRDHGWYDAWGNPYFTTNDINSLCNNDLLPVVFSMCCMSGKYTENNCLAKVFLTKQNSGCVAIFAATSVSFSGVTDALSVGMFDAIWPTPGLRPIFPSHNYQNINPISTSIYNLGGILNQGLTRIDEMNYSTGHTKKIFHLFGDPSMEIYTTLPTVFNNVSVSRSSSAINVNLNGDIAKISFYDRTINSVVSYLADNVSFNNPNNHDVIVCVNAHNKIPYIDDPKKIYLQNTTITGTKEYDADEINAGTAVTNMKPQGKVTFNGNHITLKGKEVTLEGETEVTLGTSFEILPQ